MFHANTGATFHPLENGPVNIETLSADRLLPHARSAILVHLAYSRLLAKTMYRGHDIRGRVCWYGIWSK